MKVISMNELEPGLKKDGPKTLEAFNEKSHQLYEWIKSGDLEIEVTEDQISVKINGKPRDFYGELIGPGKIKCWIMYVAAAAITVSVACLHMYFMEGHTEAEARRAVRKYVWKYRVPLVKSALTMGFANFYGILSNHGKWISLKSVAKRWDFDPVTGKFLRNDGAKYLGTDIYFADINWREKNLDYDVLQFIFR